MFLGSSYADYGIPKENNKGSENIHTHTSTETHTYTKKHRDTQTRSYGHTYTDTHTDIHTNRKVTGRTEQFSEILS